MINFGQPRVGNSKFSNFVLNIWPEHWRVVHNKDLVPHNPGSGALLDFWHTCTEKYEDANHMVHDCTNTCEDPNCASQWAPWQLSAEDHSLYLGMCMGEGCGNCAVPASSL